MHEWHNHAAVSTNLCVWSTLTTWATARHHHGSRLDTHLRHMQGNYVAIRNRKKAKDRLPPSNARTTGTDKLHIGIIPTRIGQPSPRRLKWAPTNSRIGPQQWISRTHHVHIVLCEPNNKPRLSVNQITCPRKARVTGRSGSITSHIASGNARSTTTTQAILWFTGKTWSQLTTRGYSVVTTKKYQDQQTMLKVWLQDHWTVQNLVKIRYQC